MRDGERGQHKECEKERVIDKQAEEKLKRQRKRHREGTSETDRWTDW